MIAPLVRVPLLGCSMLVCVFGDTAVARAAETDLFSNDRTVVMEYVRSHRIPRFVAAPIAKTWIADPGPMMEEVKRAADLFVSGDAEMRLAIAQAMDTCFDEGARMWDACGPDDYEARHYLLRDFAEGHDGKRAAEAREWMLSKANPSLAGPVLRALCLSLKGNISEGIRRLGLLLKGMTAEEERRLLGLLRRLYRQPGDMTFLRKGSFHTGRSRDEVREDAGPVAKYVLRAMRALTIQEAAEQLIRWMIDDGKKSPPPVRAEMWATFYWYFDQNPYVRRPRPALTREQRMELVRRDEMMELFVLTPSKALWEDGRGYTTEDSQVTAGLEAFSGLHRADDRSLATAFGESLLAQLRNPDEDVLAGIVAYIVAYRYKAGVRSALRRRIEITPHNREIVIRLVREKFAALMANRSAAECAQLETARDDILRAVQEP